MAIKAGKHVYCQKPLTRTIREARELRMAARQYKICTQMGNQGTATDDLRRGVEILRAGVLGDVKEVHVFTNRPIWPQAPKLVTRPPEEPVPAHVHWDEWIGPAKMRPYSPAYHPFKWRGFWDFGTGALGDMACHTANMPYMGLELGYPTSCQGKSGELNDETYPGWATVVFHFPARGDRPPVKLTWWEGHKPDPKDPKTMVRNIPDKGVTKGFDLPESGSLCIGDKGMMVSMSDYGTNNKIIFDGNSEGVVCNPPKLLPRHSDGGKKFNNDEAQKAEWIAAIKAGKHEIALSNFDYAGMLTEFVLMGNIGIKVPNKKLEWDGPGMKFTNDEEANQLLHREYREGWTL
jgi:predicted dehydrogenase